MAALQASLRWIDYTTPRQLSKLALAETLTHPRTDGLAVLSQRLQGTEVRAFGARRGAWPRAKGCWDGWVPCWCTRGWWC